MPALEQFKPNWTAIGVILAATINIVGWFIFHYLTKRRELQKEQRIRDEATAKERKALEAALHLSDIEMEIVRLCASEDNHLRGRVLIIANDAFGRWLSTGRHNFFDKSDASVQARYLDAFESLLARKYFVWEEGEVYRLTSIGFERAKNDT